MFGVTAVSIITIVSIVVIYTTFKISYFERIKEFGMLTSIGMSKKQKNKMLKKEAIILGLIGIPIGILCGLLLSDIVLKILNVLISNTLDTFYSLFILDSSVKLYMKVSLPALLLAIFIVYIIIFVSSMLPMRKIHKISIIDAIKNRINMKIKSRQVKSPKIIKKIFKEEGELAYKNIRRDKSRHKTIIISITISIVLFLSISGIIANLYAGIDGRDEYNDYQIIVTNKERTGEIINYLEKNKLINEYFISRVILSTNSVERDRGNMTEEVKDMIENNIYKEWEDGKFCLKINTCIFSENAYQDLLKRANLTSLGKNEVIITNTIPYETKYGDKLKLTNFNIGDKITIEIDRKEKEFIIAGIVDDFEPYLSVPKQTEFSYLSIYQIVNKETAKELEAMKPFGSYMASIFIDTNNAEKIDEAISKMEEENYCLGFNLYEQRISEEAQKAITKIVAFTFIILIVLISATNIYNTISTSILLRKKEFAELKSLGMSGKGINRMLFLEGIFYGVDSIIYGTLISIAILYVEYVFMIETKLYLFKIPILNIIISIIVTYTVIFFAMLIAKRKIKKQNIIDEIKEENI